MYSKVTSWWLAYCLSGTYPKRNKDSFPDCLQCLTVERLQNNVGFGMQMSFPLLSLKTEDCISRRYKWWSICTCCFTLFNLNATLAHWQEYVVIFVLFVIAFRLKQPFPEVLQIKHSSNQDFSEKLHFKKQSYISASKKLQLDQNSTASLGKKNPGGAVHFPAKAAACSSAQACCSSRSAFTYRLVDVKPGRHSSHDCRVKILRTVGGPHHYYLYIAREKNSWSEPSFWKRYHTGVSKPNTWLFYALSRTLTFKEVTYSFLVLTSATAFKQAA